MQTHKKVLFLTTETPLHAGSGSDLGIVDLPIQRERHTDFPKIEASGLKGSIREYFENQAKESDAQQATEEHLGFAPNDTKEMTVNKAIHRIYGYDKKAAGEYEKEAFKNHEEFAGALAFTDARLLLFPVKSMKGVFAWITCPQILERFRKEMDQSGMELQFELPGALTTTQNSELFATNNSIVLEEYTYKVQEDQSATDLAQWVANNVVTEPYWQEKLKKSMVVLPNDDFRDFVNFSSEVITRTKISNATGTVEPGALFTEEYLPEDTLMYTQVMASDEFWEDETKYKAHDIITWMEALLNDKVMQIGGNATLGKGMVKTKMKGGNSHE